MLPGCGIKRGGDGRPGRLMVLAFDGLDPRIVDELMRAGRLPNFARVARIGSYSRLATSNPAQTPVAFSNIISGADPGTHQIYDFIHRDPKIMVPYLSTSGIEGGDGISIPPWGEWRIPLFGGGQTVLLRRGNSFWEELVKHGVDTTVYYIPSNYPPKSVAGKGRFRCISGMGTPDLLGTYGEFTLFTPDAPLLGRSVGGGRFEHMQMFANVATGELAGPTDHLHKPSERRRAKALKVKFDVVRDPIHAVAKIEIAGHTLLLKEGRVERFYPHRFSIADCRLGRAGRRRCAGQPARHRAFLSQVSTPEIRAVCQPDQHRPHRTDHADQRARRLCRTTRPTARQVLHHRYSRGHQIAVTWRVDRGSVHFTVEPGYARVDRSVLRCARAF